MTLLEKLDKLEGLSEIERKKALNLYSASLSMPDDGFQEVLNYLNSIGVEIKFARDIKYLTVPISKIQEMYNILNGINETDLLVKSPKTIGMNVISIIKRIQYCIQNNIEYKNEEGYFEFIFSEKLFNAMMSKKDELEMPEFSMYDEQVPTEPSVFNSDLTTIMMNKAKLQELHRELENFNINGIGYDSNEISGGRAA